MTDRVGQRITHLQYLLPEFLFVEVVPASTDPRGRLLRSLIRPGLATQSGLESLAAEAGLAGPDHGLGAVCDLQLGEDV